ncbi:Toll-Interleukin receptor domain protein [Candidatus Magnetomorum sp. HK-1]|nr:Toll-Interleukin receptor domain protein [Candidatus Magnetomorum sp. HK-1]
MPCYTIKHEHDIFVSYAWVDDKPMFDQQKGWVSTLVDALQTKLAQELGRKDSFDLWKDERLSLNDKITPEIEKEVTNSAVLLVILSPGYMKSEWCRIERDHFLRANPNHKIFIVERNEVLDNERPEALKDIIGYKFWHREKKSEPVIILGDPKPDVNDKEYYNKINRLVYDLVVEMKRLQTINQKPDDSSIHAISTISDDSPAVFMAEPTDDVHEIWEDLQDKLKREGITVLTDRLPIHSSKECSELIQKRVSQSKCFVQVLGALPGAKIEKQTAKTIFQYDIAAKAGIKIFQLPAPELNVDQLTIEPYKALFTGNDIMPIHMEEFKREICLHVFEPPVSQSDSCCCLSGELIFLNASEVDEYLTTDIIKILKTNGLGHSLPIKCGSSKDIRENLEMHLKECDGIVIVYGAVSQQWAQAQLFQCRKIRNKRNHPLKALAVYDGPPEEKENLEMGLPNMLMINCRSRFQPSEFQPFLRKMQERRVS